MLCGDTEARRDHERGGSFRFTHVRLDIRVVEQESHSWQVAFLCCHVQRRSKPFVSNIDIRARVGYQQFDRVSMPSITGEEESRTTVVGTDKVHVDFLKPIFGKFFLDTFRVAIKGKA